jgi:uncharacterized membrane protein
MSTPIEPTPAPASGAPGGKTSFMGLDSNLAAMLCYISYFICCLGLVLGIVFVITEKENRFVKFHALQSLFLFALVAILGIVLNILTYVMAIVLNLTVGFGWIAGLLTWVVGVILLLIFAVFLIIGGIKAYGGQWFKLPLIGGFAWNAVNK